MRYLRDLPLVGPLLAALGLLTILLLVLPGLPPWALLAGWIGWAALLGWLVWAGRANLVAQRLGLHRGPDTSGE